MRKSFSKSAEVFRWGPIPGKFFYISDFWEVIFVKYPKKHPNYCWPKTMALFNGGRMLWLNDFDKLREMGGKVFVKFILPMAKRKKLKLNWHKKIQRLTKIEQKIDSIDLASLSDRKLFQLGSNFYNRLYDFWMPTISFEMGNYGSSEILENLIKEFIPNNIERLKAMEVLCAPEKLSFYQEEEVNLSKTKDIDRHAKRYFWLSNSYNEVKVLKREFFIKRKGEINKNLEKKLRGKIISSKNNKIALAKKFKLPRSIMQFSKALIDGIELQDERKKYIWISLYYKVLFLKEIARRKDINVDKLLALSSMEVLKIVNGGRYKNIIKKRSGSFGFFCDVNRRAEMGNIEAEKYWNKYALEKEIKNKKEVKGIIASPGNRRITRAKVRILLDPSEFKKFKEGEILVAPMTSPEYVFTIKKASAVITDFGGLTSHAAIVTRELNKPCLVGTKFATQIFRDGDLIEVDTNKGIARILKK